jgi:hypothetical protein
VEPPAGAFLQQPPEVLLTILALRVLILIVRPDR